MPLGRHQPLSFSLGVDDEFTHLIFAAIPGFQLDYICEPDRSRQDLDQSRVQQLRRLIEVHAPGDPRGVAIACADLSGDEPGRAHGGRYLAFLVSLRIRGAKDPARRDFPPLNYAVIARAPRPDERTIENTLQLLVQALVGKDDSELRPIDRFYHRYRDVTFTHDPARVRQVVQDQIDSVNRELHLHEGLPANDAPSSAGGPVPDATRVALAERPPYQRVHVIYPEGTGRSALISCVARLTAALCCSGMRWTAVSTGREREIPGGIYVRLLPPRDPLRRDTPGTLDLYLQDLGSQTEVLGQLRPAPLATLPEIGAAPSYPSLAQAPSRPFEQRRHGPSGDPGAAVAARSVVTAAALVRLPLRTPRPAGTQARWGQGLLALGCATAAGLLALLLYHGHGRRPSTLSAASVRPPAPPVARPEYGPCLPCADVAALRPQIDAANDALVKELRRRTATLEQERDNLRRHIVEMADAQGSQERRISNLSDRLKEALKRPPAVVPKRPGETRSSTLGSGSAAYADAPPASPARTQAPPQTPDSPRPGPAAPTVFGPPSPGTAGHRGGAQSPPSVARPRSAGPPLEVFQ